MNVPQNNTSASTKLLKGRTGVVVEVISNEKAVLRDNKYDNIPFSKDVVKFPINDKFGFKLTFCKMRQVYYDLELDDTGKARCKCIWIGKKHELELNNLLASSAQPQLKENVVYKTTVKKIRHPFAFIAEENVLKIHIYVWNQAFMPKRNSPKLNRNEPVICYVKEGDTVYVKVRPTNGKEFEWAAWDAWMEDNDDSKNSQSSQARKKFDWHKARPALCGINKTPLAGKLSHVYHKTAILENELNDQINFHRDNAFLFGIPLKNVRLDKIFSKGDELNYILYDELLDEASCVWIGSRYNTSDDIAEMQKRISDFIKYCQDKGIDPEIQKTLLQLDGKLQKGSTANEISGENVKPDSQTSKMKKCPFYNLELATKNDSKSLPVGATSSKSAPEMAKIEKIARLPFMTGINLKEDVHEYNKLDKKQSTKNTELDMKKDKDKQCITIIDSVNSYEKDALLESIASTINSTELDTEKDRQNNEGSETNISDISSSEKGIAVEGIASAINSPEFDKQNNECSGTIISNVSSSEEDFSLEGTTGIKDSKQQLINKTVANCLKKSLLQILKKEFGEDTSEILTTYAINFFTKELEQYVMQGLMKKTIYATIREHLDRCETDVKEANLKLQSQSNTTKSIRNRMRRIAHYWKKDTSRMLEEEKSKHIKKKMDSLLIRAKLFQEKLNSTFLDVKSDDSDTDDSVDDFDDKNDSFEKCDQEEENGLVHIVQDFMKIQNNDLFQTVLQNSSVEKKETDFVDNGTQTTSTGRILYLKYLTDL